MTTTSKWSEFERRFTALKPGDETGRQAIVADQKEWLTREVPIASSLYDDLSHEVLAECADQWRARLRFGLATADRTERELAAINEAARKRPQTITGTMGG